MRKIIADIYRILYRLTGNNTVSLSLALAYVTALNMMAVFGLCSLLRGWLGVMGLALKLFHFPLIVVTAVVMLLIDISVISPLKNLWKEKRKKPALIPIMLYTLIAVLIYLYTHYGEVLI